MKVTIFVYIFNRTLPDKVYLLKILKI